MTEQGGLRGKRILICNDDGIGAVGLKVLEQAALALCDDVWVVAPATEQSGKAHSFTIGSPMTAEKLSDRRYAVSGTPTDCVLYAFNVLLKDKKPDLVLAGINHGENVGLDLLYSGTVGIATEAALQGAKGFAFSLAGAKKGSAFWDVTGRRVVRVLPVLAGTDGANVFNVNFPATNDPAPMVSATVCDRKIGDDIDVLSVDGNKTVFSVRSTRSAYAKTPDCDAEALMRGCVTVTALTAGVPQSVDVLKNVDLTLE